MGRRPRGYDPDGFENSRKRQKRREIAPLPREAPPAPQEDPTSTALQPSRSSRIDMAASVPNSTQHATSTPQTAPGPNANTNSGGLYTTVGQEHDETLTEGRVKIVPGRRVGITEDYANQLDLFLNPRPESRRRSIAEGPRPTDIIRNDHSAMDQIRHPGSSDPNEATYLTVDEEEQPPEQPANDEGQSPNQSVDVHGLQFMTINTRQDLSALVEGEHDDLSNGGHCQRCFDDALLENGIGSNNLYDTSA